MGHESFDNVSLADQSQHIVLNGIQVIKALCLKGRRASDMSDAVACLRLIYDRAKEMQEEIDVLKKNK